MSLGRRIMETIRERYQMTDFEYTLTTEKGPLTPARIVAEGTEGTIRVIANMKLGP
jgi:hypothetical protein